MVTPLPSFSDAEGSQPFGFARASNGRFYGFTDRAANSASARSSRFTPASAPTTVHGFAGRQHTRRFVRRDQWDVYALTAGGGDFEKGAISRSCRAAPSETS